VVLGTNEYERITSEREAQRLVEAISYGNALVLVGFGAPLDTVQFKALRTWLTTSPGERHLRLVTTHERARFSSAALVEERQHIDLIGYGDDFADLGPFLRSLVAAPVPPAERAPGSTIPPEREAVVGGVRLEPGDSHWVRRVGPLISTVAFVLAVFQALGIIGIATLMCAVSTGIAVAMLDDLFVRKRRTALRKAALLTSALAALACVTISFAAPEPGVGIRSPTAQTSLGNGSGGRNAPSAGFSPARPTYDYAKYDSNDDCGDPTNVALRRGRCGSRQPVYNSFVNVPGIGDEREFFDGFRSDHPQAFSVADPVDNVTGGSRKVVLRIYINNDARYDAARPRANAIHGALVRVFLPSTTGKSAVLRAYLSARNARTVSDSLVFTGTKPFSLQVVPRSAKLYTRNRSYPLDGEIVGHAGVAVGDRRPNGTVAASTTVGQATVHLTVRVIDG
jgi:hypothetical protein